MKRRKNLSQSRRNTNLFWQFTGVVLIINLVSYLALKDKPLAFVSDFLPVLCSFIGLVFVGKTVRTFTTYNFAKLTWLFLFIGLVLNFLAESIYGIMELFLGYNMNETFPTLADCFWYGGYIFFFLGLLSMLIGYKKSGFPLGNIRSYLVTTFFIAAIFIIVIYFLLVPILTDEETSSLAKMAYLLYPVFDILVASLAIILMLIVSQFGKSSVAKPWTTLAVGFILFAISDLLYSYLGWHDRYGNGNLIDLGWNVGYLLIGISALYQKNLVLQYTKEE